MMLTPITLSLQPIQVKKAPHLQVTLQVSNKGVYTYFNLFVLFVIWPLPLCNCDSCYYVCIGATFHTVYILLPLVLVVLPVVCAVVLYALWRLWRKRRLPKSESKRGPVDEESPKQGEEMLAGHTMRLYQAFVLCLESIN